MKYVYIVQHVNPKNDDEKHIGSYTSYKEAQEVVEKYKGFKGFKDAPDSFYIDAYELDKMYWAEGYCTIKVKRKQS